MRSDTPCKIWTGALDSHGYAMQGHTRVAREVLEKKQGYPIKEGLECCHHCDTPACIEAEHLFAGTHGQNIRDAVAKGRMKSNWPHPEKTHCLRGHALVSANIYIHLGKRHCRECRKIRDRELRERRRHAQP